MDVQKESPFRKNAYFLTTLEGDTLVPYKNPYRFVIEAELGEIPVLPTAATLPATNIAKDSAILNAEN